MENQWDVECSSFCAHSSALARSCAWISKYCSEKIFNNIIKKSKYSTTLQNFLIREIVYSFHLVFFSVSEIFWRNVLRRTQPSGAHSHLGGRFWCYTRKFLFTSRPLRGLIEIVLMTETEAAPVGCLRRRGWRTPWQCLCTRQDSSAAGPPPGRWEGPWGLDMSAAGVGTRRKYCYTGRCEVLENISISSKVFSKTKPNK